MITRCFSSEMQGERELTYLTPQSANVTLGDKGHREDVRFNLESSSWLWAVRRKQTKQTNKKRIVISSRTPWKSDNKLWTVFLSASWSSWTFFWLWSHTVTVSVTKQLNYEQIWICGFGIAPLMVVSKTEGTQKMLGNTMGSKWL